MLKALKTIDVQNSNLHPGIQILPNRPVDLLNKPEIILKPNKLYCHKKSLHQKIKTFIDNASAISIPIKQLSINSLCQSIPTSNSSITVKSFNNIPFTGLDCTCTKSCTQKVDIAPEQRSNSVNEIIKRSQSLINYDQQLWRRWGNKLKPSIQLSYAQLVHIPVVTPIDLYSIFQFMDAFVTPASQAK